MALDYLVKSTTRNLNRQIGVVLFFLLLLSTNNLLAADGFAGGVTPSRFEVTANAGDVVRRSIDIYNLGDRPTEFSISTADWTYSDLGQIDFFNELAQDSCRPWVKLENHRIQVVASAYKPRSFRFEVHVPSDQTRLECRFAIMLDSYDQVYDTSIQGGLVKLPVAGRIAVIVYIQIGGATPDLQLETIILDEYQGAVVPMVKVTNLGDAHGRLDADLTGTTESGQKIKLGIASSPILAKQTRNMPLNLINKETIAGDTLYPLRVRGKIYADKQTFDIDAVLTPE